MYVCIVTFSIELNKKKIMVWMIVDIGKSDDVRKEIHIYIFIYIFYTLEYGYKFTKLQLLPNLCYSKIVAII